MNFAWNYLFILIWIGYLICSGVFLFSRGFLLSRVSKKDTNTCRHLSSDPNKEYYLSEELIHEIFKNVNATPSLCLPKKSKIIVLLVDALKYDFGLYKENIKNPLPFENKLTILHELLLTEPHNSRLMKFIADPPTTTLQRLKGLTTGSLPTFIDIGSNFASPEINEDNLIDQLTNNGLSSVFMGDSTWTDLYPKRFKRQYSYPSFDIFDLDTVDKNIMKILPKELETTDWDVLIAHFLGVDHCGHRYGPLHPEMTRKLNEVNEVIRFVIEKMDNDTTLLIMGDHGMTMSGDHGGESSDEINALLFAYSKSKKFLSHEFGSDNTTLRQIDLVPTLSVILGVPIPYSNLGLLNFNIIPDIEVPYMIKYQLLLLHAYQNLKQIYNYFYQYAIENSRTLSHSEMQSIEVNFEILIERMKTIYSEAAFKSVMNDLNLQLREILNICHNLWVKFDPNQMSQGLLLTFLPIFFTFLLVHNSNCAQLIQIFTVKTICNIYLINFAVGVFGYRYYNDMHMRSEEHSIIFCTGIISTVILVFLILQNWSQIATNGSHMKRLSNIPSRIIYIFACIVYFSNSFIIQEAKILSYLLIALIMMLNYDVFIENYRTTKIGKFKLRTFIRSTAFKLIMCGVLGIIMIRFTYVLFKCREEQGNCDFANTSANRPSTKIYLISVTSLIMVTTLSRMYLRACGNLTGFSANIILARYGPTVAVICTSSHLLLSMHPIKTIKLIHIDGIAWVIYILLGLQLLMLTVSPLMTYVLPPKPVGTISVNPYENVIPQIFKKIKKVYEGSENDRKNEIPVVYGLATIYSSILISFSVFLAVTLVLLLGVKPAIGLLLCVGVACIILTLNGVLRYKTANTIESCVQPSFNAVITWFLLAHFCFFATSHQTTLSQIDWRAAFKGRSANFDNSNFISGFLVILNTFCGQIFFMTIYGLLCSETFSIYALFPGLKNLKTKFSNDLENNVRQTTVTKNSDLSSNAYKANDFDITRGELILFENDYAYFGSLFKLGTQFFILQGVRVFCSMMACTIHCRHLMVWKIFAPRFIYEGLSTFILVPSVIFGYLILCRIHWSLNRLINRINKTK